MFHIDIFKDIPLSTLCLLGRPSIIAVNYQTKTTFRFNVGPSIDK
ncbi:unnamed protein product [Onchocerca flexuosa]|uniref:Uncharacterized protein n=1 Tax=Onchocerca flexuosa TaxID=387005 RepID=A0A183HUV8_9BILA|nr:unnamed protein product [Onchocerca flexuosa]